MDSGASTCFSSNRGKRTNSHAPRGKRPSATTEKRPCHRMMTRSKTSKYIEECANNFVPLYPTPITISSLEKEDCGCDVIFKVLEAHGKVLKKYKDRFFEKDKELRRKDQVIKRLKEQVTSCVKDVDLFKDLLRK